MSVVRVKPGVLFIIIAPGGFRMLAAVDQAADKSEFDLTITSACDGEHSGPSDPHHRGEAYDLRTHDLGIAQKQSLLDLVMSFLDKERFYGFIESPNTDNEHIHIQVRKGTTYP